MIAGATLLELNEYEQSRQDLEQALALKPTIPGLYTLVGTARDKTGNVKEAESSFREALKENPDDFEANLYLGLFSINAAILTTQRFTWTMRFA